MGNVVAKADTSESLLTVDSDLAEFHWRAGSVLIVTRRRKVRMNYGLLR